MTLSPVTEIDLDYSNPGAEPVPWSTAVSTLEQAEVFWITTVRPDGRPHVVPIIAVWLDDAMYFCTGAAERKAKNLAANPNCTLSTGTNLMSEGIDIMLEGIPDRVEGKANLQRIADKYLEKYGTDWKWDVHEDGFRHAADSLREGHQVSTPVFELAPVTAFGFGRGGQFTQTRWTF